MDNFLLQAIVAELASLLPGMRLGKVYQIGATDLAIDFRLRDGRWLIVSTDPQRLALYLTARNPKQLGEELRTDTAFASLLKKYLGGARLAAVEKLGYDRVVHFDFAAEDDDGQTRLRTLVVMLTGRAANVLIVEEARVLASLRERDEAITSYTEPAPPADKLDPFQLSADKLDELIAAHDGDIAAAARKHLIGFSALYAGELRHRAGARPPFEALQSLLGELFDSPPKPTIYSLPSIEELKREIGREEFSLVLSPIELEVLRCTADCLVCGGLGKEALGFPRNAGPDAGSRLDSLLYADANTAADAYFTLLDERRGFLAAKQRLQSQLTRRLKKQRTLLGNLRRELAAAANAETHQRWGELLLANLHQAAKSGEGFAVTDFYDESQATIVIPSANKADAKEAAEYYFKLARKARHARQTIGQRLPEVERETTALEQQVARLSAITRADDPRQFAPQSDAPQPRQPRSSSPQTTKPREEKLSGVRRYRSSDGYEILVGRADRDNDHLTFRIAKSFDLWFHAADYPGSHVVLRNPQRKPVPARAITEAAQLAAKFSQARSNPKVAVNYCEKKFVTKPKGFAPGQVRLSSFKTVLVEPAEAGERI